MYLITELIEIDSFSDLCVYWYWLMDASNLVTFKPIHMLFNNILSSCKLKFYKYMD